MTVRLEVRIPISPRPDYFNRVCLIAASIHDFYPDAVVRVTVGAETYPQMPDMPGIVWHCLPAEEFSLWAGTAHQYISTIMERFRPPFLGDYVLMIDADVMPMGKFDELFTFNEITGVMAHSPPFRSDGWVKLFHLYNIKTPHIGCRLEHSGWNVFYDNLDLRFGPAYFNTGVIFAPSHVLEKFYEPYNEALFFTKKMLDSYFFEQIAMALAIEKEKLPVRLLPIRYNYANYQEFDIRRPSELADVRFLHFLCTDIVRREADFQNRETIMQLIRRQDLYGSNERLRQRLADIMERHKTLGLMA